MPAYTSVVELYGNEEHEWNALTINNACAHESKQICTSSQNTQISISLLSTAIMVIKPSRYNNKHTTAGNWWLETNHIKL